MYTRCIKGGISIYTCPDRYNQTNINIFWNWREQVSSKTDIKSNTFQVWKGNNMFAILLLSCDLTDNLVPIFFLIVFQEIRSLWSLFPVFLKMKLCVVLMFIVGWVTLVKSGFSGLNPEWTDAISKAYTDHLVKSGTVGILYVNICVYVIRYI